MRTLVKEALEAKVNVYNPDHSFVVSGVGDGRLCRYISQIPGVTFASKRDQFSLNGVDFSIDDGGDTGGDGLWIMPKDGQPHPDELRIIREHIQRRIEENPPSKAAEIAAWLTLGVSFLVCASVCFATLHTLTTFPPWASLALSVPSGAGLFYIAYKFAS